MFARFELTPGSYVIIPATFEPDCPSRFMIRVYSANKFNLRHLRHSRPGEHRQGR